MMESAPLHRWDVTPKEARLIQEEMRHRVVTVDRYGMVKRIAGIDAGFPQKGRITRAAVAVLSYPDLEFVEQSVAEVPTTFPYVPGLLSFREVPAVLEALAGLSRPPDMILYDGQGLAHPRRFGVACHVGVLTDLPTIGVAKSRLTGTHAPLPEDKGAHVDLMDGEERIGVVLRTRSHVRPVYVSVGHRVSLETSMQIVMACITRYRLPETTRWADRIASGYAR